MKLNQMYRASSDEHFTQKEFYASVTINKVRKSYNAPECEAITDTLHSLYGNKYTFSDAALLLRG